MHSSSDTVGDDGGEFKMRSVINLNSSDWETSLEEGEKFGMV